MFEEGAVAVDEGNLAFPRSYILTTSIFDEFMEKNNLPESVNEKCWGRISIEELDRRILSGEFEEEHIAYLSEILQKERGPLIVRSSSLLEDSLVHSFAGIYHSEFIPNTGTEHERLERLILAVKRVYDSTYNLNAKAYRKRHGIPWQNEKMAILIQNVVGSDYCGLFYPVFAGVAFSKNYYPWSERIRVEDGIVRLVFGLGTKAVGRSYARVLSPGAPGIRPEGAVIEKILRYSQPEFDALDMEKGEVVTKDIDCARDTNPHITKVFSVLREGMYFMNCPRYPRKEDRLVATFDPIINSTRYIPFVPMMRAVMSQLEEVFDVPVDIEFAGDFEGSRGTLYLVQVRPFVTRIRHKKITLPEDLKERMLLKSNDILGNGILEDIKYVVYVPPETYSIERAYAIARQVGRVNEGLEDESCILIGPGRWGTTNPQLGIPVHYFEISNARVVVEMSFSRFSPEFSYGTHFFGDLVSTNVIYMPVFRERGDFVNTEFLNSQPSLTGGPYVKLIKWEKGIRVYADGRRRVGVAELL
ncbi:MAG: phosphoenolpyruvate synthase [Thermoprotei archaeon]|nr:MAG: phosphoenolpyruvate synthase [Thermoprotei archaeon]